MKQELHDFFKANSSYRKVMEEIALKYYRYGKITGSISLKKFSETEQADIADFLGCDLARLKEKKQFSIKTWQKVYEQSRFRSIDFTQAVELVIGHDLQTKRTEQAIEQAKKERYMQLFSQKKELAFVSSERQLDFYRKQVTEEELWTLADLFRERPDSLIYLPVFAQQKLKNPHGLDRKTRLGKLFYTLLSDKIQLLREPDESQTEYRSRIYNQQNLVVDDLMNFVTVSNLLGKVATDKIHSMWQGACDNQVIWNVPIKALLDVKEVIPKVGNEVFVFENSFLYSSLMTEFPDLPAICHQGQFRLAMWRLLELFSKTTRFYYASDMDPEGLQMADKIKSRYGDRVVFLYMDVQSYRKKQSVKDISRSISKLSTLNDPDLIDVAEAMREEKVASYQESFYQEYVRFIDEWYKLDELSN